MTIQITIIGLGQIGTSMGLAMEGQSDKIQRVGHDREPTHARGAQKLGAIDKVVYNLHKAVQDADLVLLALPIDQIRTTMELIAPDLKENAVVMDTAPIKGKVIEWAQELIPPQCHYVGLTPVLNPTYLNEAVAGVEGAHADLFKNGLIAIVTPTGTDSAAIKLAVDLTSLIGSIPLFADPVEVDSLMAATHLLPHLVAAALLHTTVEQPGWLEARKFAGRAYAQVTSPMGLMDQPGALGSASTLNQENVLRVMDNLIQSLQDLRKSIAKNDSRALKAQLAQAREARSHWWRERQAAEWTQAPSSETDVPSATELIGRMFFGRRQRGDRSE